MEPYRKVLFLDIDGVVNSGRSQIAFGKYPHDLTSDRKFFDNIALAMIRKLCYSNDIQICVSSSWRYEFTAHEMANALDLPIVSVTPTFGETRGEEIRDWLLANPDVAHYAIVDDINEMLEEQQSNFVKTDPDEGLLYRDYLQIASILEATPFLKWPPDPPL